MYIYTYIHPLTAPALKGLKRNKRYYIQHNCERRSNCNLKLNNFYSITIFGFVIRVTYIRM
jgi:hypothetical protein